jgi:hypothetical protein
MAKAQNGRHNGPGRADAPAITAAGQGHSGRRFVVGAVIVVLVTWGGLYLVFHRWRANYRERVAFGASKVVPVIDPLKDVTPPGVDPTAWRDAVDETHAMLATVVGSNLLDRGDMDNLRVELGERVARVQSHPETATAELTAIWNEMADRAEFLFQDSRDPTRDRHVRPKILSPRPAPEKAQKAAAGIR